jgi:NAD-dependent deacetylase
MRTGDSFERSIDALYEMISGARYCTALTGAGVSTLSGIRDFRGKNGLYRETDAEKIFDIGYFSQDPSFYYKAALSFIYNLDEKEASIVHLTLGKLEKLGRLKAVITQNIDLLHQKGGSRRVIEIHGSPLIHYCLRCSDKKRVEDLAAARGGMKNPGASSQVSSLDRKFIIPAGDIPRSENRVTTFSVAVNFPEQSPGYVPGPPIKAYEADLMDFKAAAVLVRSGELPRCGKCGAVLKPAITFFGESLPVRALEDAEQAARDTDLMLVLGTSLTVFPAASLPQITIRSGGKIVIVNNMETPLDRYAALRFDDLETVFRALNSRL